MGPTRQSNSASERFTPPPLGGNPFTPLPVRRPLIGLLACFAIGTGLGLRFLFEPLVLLALAVVTLFLCVWRRRSEWSPVALYATLLLLAVANASIHQSSPSGRELSRLMERPREQLLVRGTIIDDPVREWVDEAASIDRWRMTLELEAVNRIGYLQRATGRVDVWWNPAGPESQADIPAYGDVWEFHGVVQQREHREWAWSFLPSYRLRVDRSEAVRLESGAGSWLKRVSYAGRRAAADQLALGIDAFPDLVGIMRALLLGYRHELPDEHHRLFAWTGTLHIFAISGLHVGILAGLVLSVLRAAGVRRQHWLWWLAPVLILYTVGTGLRPSAMRACAMTLAFSAAFSFNRKPDAPSAWAFAALMILIAAPAQLVAPGFIFSFVIVAGLIRLYPIFAGAAKARWAADPHVALDPDSSRSGWRGWLMALVGLMAASASAWLSSVPLTAQYFNLFSPVGLLGNILVIPAAFVIVTSGLLALLAGLVSDLGTEVFNHSTRAVLQGLIWAIDHMSAWPASYFYVRSPGWFWVVLWYGFVFGGLCWATVRARAQGYGVLLAIGLVGALVQFGGRGSRVQLLPAGDGHAVLIQSAGKSWLYDAGPAYRAEAVIRALRAQGVNELEALVLSHASASHAGGARAIMAAMPVHSVWHTDFASRSPAYDEALDYADHHGIPRHLVRAGNQGAWGAGWWEVLHPNNTGDWRRAADASIVLRFSQGVHAVLLSGGAGKAVAADMMAREVHPGATVWVIGNQGRAETVSSAWLHAMQPSAVAVDVSAYNRHGWPDRAVMQRLIDESEADIWRTDLAGPVTVQLSSRVRWGRQRDTWQVRAAWGGPEEGQAYFID